MHYYQIVKDGVLSGYMRSKTELFSETYQEISEEVYFLKTGLRQKEEGTLSSVDDSLLEKMMDAIIQ